MYFDYVRSAYYKSFRAEAVGLLEEDIVCELVQDIRRYQPCIGGKKLYHLLRNDLAKLTGSVGRDKLFDILRSHGLLVKRKKKYAYTTDSFHRFRVYKNQVKGKVLTRAHQVCVSDITYLRTRSGFVYLFLITDAFSRKIIGWALSDSLSIESGLKALQMAIKQCPTSAGVIHHSDRGIQYCSHDYIALLKKNEMIISMTEENHCYENAVAERVNGILKQDFLLDETFDNITVANKAVKEAVEVYNHRRPHWSLNLCTPEQVHQAA